MYEELVRQLRILSGTDNISTFDEAADAIEELAKDLERSKEYETFWNKKAEEALRRFQVAVANKPRWIPVAERLPENEVPVQVVYLGVNDGKQYSDLIACVFEGVWCYWDGEPCSYDECECEITHWQPLPEPPKEET